jgi:cytosine/adenosine deaminase-related metal-dependent hydrolase
MIDILITGGTVVTMDPERSVIDDGAVAIEGDSILQVGRRDELEAKYDARKVIDGHRKVVLPGLIDAHAHAGHALVKTMGVDLAEERWVQVCETTYTKGSTEGYWHADALLSALERVKFGTTCGVSFFGGGESFMRTDDPVYGDRHCEAVQSMGIRDFLVVGPSKPPYPRLFSHWDGQTRRDKMVSFEDQLRTMETLVRRWQGKANGRIQIGITHPTYHPGSSSLDQSEMQGLKKRTLAAREVSRSYGLLFTQDGHTRGSVEFAHKELGMLGPDVLLSHATELTADEISICRETDTKIVHNPSAVMSMRGRCPVPELIDAGVTVALGSDAASPDRSYDMFRHMFQCMRYHRRHFRDPSYMPAGKVLEMATIDGARALGLESEIGSLEVGKKADVILVDMFKPHLFPLNMPVHRIAYFANGNDVDTVIVDGQVVMEHRQMLTVDEEEVLEMAQEETVAMLNRTQQWDALEFSERFWGHSRL